MNEQIQLLAEQATRKYDRLGNDIPFAQPDLELFAQLIVQECIDAAVEAQADFYIVHNIKSRFGIEE
jgi:hypothetical protein